VCVCFEGFSGLNCSIATGKKASVASPVAQKEAFTAPKRQRELSTANGSEKTRGCGLCNCRSNSSLHDQTAEDDLKFELNAEELSPRSDNNCADPLKWPEMYYKDFPVHIHRNNIYAITMKVRLLDNVSSLKTRVSNALGLNKAAVTLRYKQKTMKDRLSLVRYNVQRNATLYLLVDSDDRPVLLGGAPAGEMDTADVVEEKLNKGVGMKALYKCTIPNCSHTKALNGYSRHADLKNHVNHYHLRKKYKFKCPVPNCSRGPFSSKRNLNKHDVKWHNGDHVQKRYRCQMSMGCNQHFRTKDLLLEHIRVVHLSCQRCRKSFETNEDLFLHERLCGNNLPAAKKQRQLSLDHLDGFEMGSPLNVQQGMGDVNLVDFDMASDSFFENHKDLGNTVSPRLFNQSVEDVLKSQLNASERTKRRKRSNSLFSEELGEIVFLENGDYSRTFDDSGDTLITTSTRAGAAVGGKRKERDGGPSMTEAKKKRQKVKHLGFENGEDSDNNCADPLKWPEMYYKDFPVHIHRNNIYAITMKVRLLDNVSSLKTRVSNALGLNKASVTLRYKQKTMEDRLSLVQYNVQRNATLYLLVDSDDRPVLLGGARANDAPKDKQGEMDTVRRRMRLRFCSVLDSIRMLGCLPPLSGTHTNRECEKPYVRPNETFRLTSPKQLLRKEIYLWILTANGSFLCCRRNNQINGGRTTHRHIAGGLPARSGGECMLDAENVLWVNLDSSFSFNRKDGLVLSNYNQGYTEAVRAMAKDGAYRPMQAIQSHFESSLGGTRTILCLLFKNSIINNTDNRYGVLADTLPEEQEIPCATSNSDCPRVQIGTKTGPQKDLLEPKGTSFRHPKDACAEYNVNMMSLEAVTNFLAENAPATQKETNPRSAPVDTRYAWFLRFLGSQFEVSGLQTLEPQWVTDDYQGRWDDCKLYLLLSRDAYLKEVGSAMARMQGWYPDFIDRDSPVLSAARRVVQALCDTLGQPAVNKTLEGQLRAAQNEELKKRRKSLDHIWFSTAHCLRCLGNQALHKPKEASDDATTPDTYAEAVTKTFSLVETYLEKKCGYTLGNGIKRLNGLLKELFKQLPRVTMAELNALTQLKSKPFDQRLAFYVDHTNGGVKRSQAFSKAKVGIHAWQQQWNDYRQYLSVCSSGDHSTFNLREIRLAMMRMEKYYAWFVNRDSVVLASCRRILQNVCNFMGQSCEDDYRSPLCWLQYHYGSNITWRDWLDAAGRANGLGILAAHEPRHSGGRTTAPADYESAIGSILKFIHVFLQTQCGYKYGDGARKQAQMLFMQLPQSTLFEQDLAVCFTRRESKRRAFEAICSVVWLELEKILRRSEIRQIRAKKHFQRFVKKLAKRRTEKQNSFVKVYVALQKQLAFKSSDYVTNRNQAHQNRYHKEQEELRYKKARSSEKKQKEKSRNAAFVTADGNEVTEPRSCDWDLCKGEFYARKNCSRCLLINWFTRAMWRKGAGKAPICINCEIAKQAAKQVSEAARAEMDEVVLPKKKHKKDAYGELKGNESILVKNFTKYQLKLSKLEAEAKLNEYERLMEIYDLEKMEKKKKKLETRLLKYMTEKESVLNQLLLLWGGTALHKAAFYTNNPELINALVDAGADVNARNKAGSSPLMCAASRNNHHCLEALLSRGCSKAIIMEVLAYENIDEVASLCSEAIDREVECIPSANSQTGVNSLDAKNVDREESKNDGSGDTMTTSSRRDMAGEDNWEPGDVHERDQINVALWQQENERKINAVTAEDYEVAKAKNERKGNWNS